VLLSGGWTLAAARQPHGYDAVRDTISALAARGATDRWVMTAALAGLGACHVITATGLRPARGAGRMVLAFGGVATVLVAAFPEPSQGGSEAYTVAASPAFTSLAIWPAFAVRRVPGAPLLTPTACVAATASTAPLTTTSPRPNAASTTTRLRSPTDPRRTSPRSEWGPPSAARRRRWPAPHSVLAPPDRRPPPPAPTRPVPDAGDQGPLTMESMRRGRHMAISAAPGRD
jgi:hypothetical protein